uniref:Ig-like domain-containing protein n=1 Tax=Strongyloides venezuelensis TaxID=75913 RepID=A0A0K0G1Y9_STRVS
MKFCYFLFLYFLNTKISNNFLLSQNNEWGTYECSAKSSLNGKERFFIITNINVITNRIEEYYYLKDINTAPTTDSHIIENVSEDINVLAKKVIKLMIPLESLYFNYYNVPVDFKNNINFLFCPLEFASKLGVFNENYEEKAIGKYVNGTRCSVYKCDIGPFPMVNSHANISHRILIDKELEKVFFIGFQTSPNKNIDYIFFYNAGKPAGNINIVLVACPYKNWIRKQSSAKFIPSKYVKNDFPSLPNDMDRHKLVPTFILENISRGQNFPSRNTFTCGRLEQYEKLADPTPIKIGYEFDQLEDISSQFLTIEGEELFCGDVDITDHYIFTFLNSTDIFNSSEPNMEYVTSIKSVNFYVNQKIYAYDKEYILSKYNDSAEEFFDTDNDLPIFPPSCIANHRVEIAKLKLKIGSTIVNSKFKKDKFTGENIETYTVSVKEQKDQELSCHAVLLKNSDDRYTNFYNKKYSTRIKKIKDANGKPYSGNASTAIKITESIEEVAGVYTCTIYNSKVHEILDSEFHILPGELDPYIKKVKNNKPNKHLYRCTTINMMSNQTLIEMNVTHQGKKTMSFQFSNKNRNKNFKKYKHYVIYNPDDESRFNLPTEIKCTYMNFSSIDNPTVEQNIQTYHTDNTRHSISSIIFIPIGFGTILIILIVILKIIYAISLIRYNKKKAAVLNSNSCSSETKTESDSSTLSSKSNSRSRSNSISSIKTKNIESKTLSSQTSNKKKF